jgi:NAD-dependent dihydropyrimidine dehydrogenase PreA subunit
MDVLSLTLNLMTLISLTLNAAGALSMKIKIDYIKCEDCRSYTCVDACAMAVFGLQDGKPVIVDLDSCTLCGICEDLCPKKAITIEK